MVDVKSGQGKAGTERGRKRKSPADKEEEVSAKMMKEELTAVQQINMVGFFTPTENTLLNLFRAGVSKL